MIKGLLHRKINFMFKVDDYTVFFLATPDKGLTSAKACTVVVEVQSPEQQCAAMSVHLSLRAWPLLDPSEFSLAQEDFFSPPTTPLNLSKYWNVHSTYRVSAYPPTL